MKNHNKKISVVIPILNEEKIIGKNSKKLLNYLKSLEHIKEFEIILVENGSNDNTLEIAKRLANIHPEIIVESIPSPSWGEAYRKGVAKANMTFIGRASRLLSQYPIVLGSRYIQGAKIKRPLHRRIISIFNAPIVNAAFGTKFTDIDGIRAIRKKLAKKIISRTTAMGSFWDTELMVLLSKSKLPYIEIPVNHIEFRKSKFKIRKLVINHFFQLISNFSRLNIIEIII